MVYDYAEKVDIKSNTVKNKALVAFCFENRSFDISEKCMASPYFLFGYQEHLLSSAMALYLASSREKGFKITVENKEKMILKAAHWKQDKQYFIRGDSRVKSPLAETIISRKTSVRHDGSPVSSAQVPFNFGICG